MAARACGLALFLLGLTLALPAAGRTVYQWTDEAGVTHFGDTPPAGQDYQTREMEGGAPPGQPEGGESTADKSGPEADGGADLTEAINLDEARLRLEKLAERVANARRQYEQARRNRVEGEETRLGSERNYVRYLERIKQLKAREAQARQQLQDLQQQLEAARKRLEEMQSRAEAPNGP